jgi:hypothetical protein
LREPEPVVHDLTVTDLERAVVDRRLLHLLREGYAVGASVTVEDRGVPLLRLVMVPPRPPAVPADLLRFAVGLLALLAIEGAALVAFLLSRAQ